MAWSINMSRSFDVIILKIGISSSEAPKVATPLDPRSRTAGALSSLVHQLRNASIAWPWLVLHTSCDTPVAEATAPLIWPEKSSHACPSSNSFSSSEVGQSYPACSTRSPARRAAAVPPRAPLPEKLAKPIDVLGRRLLGLRVGGGHAGEIGSGGAQLVGDRSWASRRRASGFLAGW